MNLRVSENHRYLEDEAGQPFFYLADTAWEMIHRLGQEDVEEYLSDRAAKGFTVVQTVILAEEDGLSTPNAAGDRPLHGNDPATPNEAYFTNVDKVLQRAQEHGLILALLPTWGDKWNRKWGVGPVVFTPENAAVYGEFLGRRYAKTPNIIWLLGGDRPIEDDNQRAIIEAMAKGLETGGSRHLKSFHPCGGQSSAPYWHDSSWLDFNMLQTGHVRNSPNFLKVADDYARTPVKPVLDGEPNYDDHKSAGLQNGYMDDYDTRKAMYWALFSGACGHTHGCHAIWQFWEPGRTPVNHPRRHWKEALSLPAAKHVGLARKLHGKYPFLTGTPATELISDQHRDGDEELLAFHISALRGKDNKFLLCYFPCNVTAEVNLADLPGKTVVAQWFDVRSGEFLQEESLPACASRAFTAPGYGPDWVLTLTSR